MSVDSITIFTRANFSCPFFSMFFASLSVATSFDRGSSTRDLKFIPRRAPMNRQYQTRRIVVSVSFLLLLMQVAVHHALAQTETVLYNFANHIQQFYDGPSLTADGLGNFYGVAPAGGSHLSGSVFELSPDEGGGWTYNEIYSFCSQPSCTDGETPIDSVIFDSLGNLYGTTFQGGASGLGAVFQLVPNGGGWTETVLYNFTSEFYNPLAGLTMDAAGNIYGTTWQNGGVFELSPSGDGWSIQLIAINASSAYSTVAVDNAGNLYSVTEFEILEFSPNDSGGWDQTLLHSFAGGPKDGINPYGGPVLDKAGNLYGATTGGGRKNLGTVYKLTRTKKGTWNYRVLYSFKGGKHDCAVPVGIVLDKNGNIYGSASGSDGGKFTDGAIFEITAPVAKVGYKETIVWGFDGTNGTAPRGAPVFVNNNLYGIADNGGTSNNGVAFEIVF
jgi:uncharacterized repeat protein (TIGR03803 family)